MTLCVWERHVVAELAGLGVEEVAVVGAVRSRPAVQQVMYPADGSVTCVTVLVGRTYVSEKEPDVGACLRFACMI